MKAHRTTGPAIMLVAVVAISCGGDRPGMATPTQPSTNDHHRQDNGEAVRVDGAPVDPSGCLVSDDQVF